jgi:hypothetical protein
MENDNQHPMAAVQQLPALGALTRKLIFYIWNLMELEFAFFACKEQGFLLRGSFIRDVGPFSCTH